MTENITCTVRKWLKTHPFLDRHGTLDITRSSAAYADAIGFDNVHINDLTLCLIATETWDPGSIANGAEEMEEVTVTGAQLGDFALASFSLDVADLTFTADVTAENTVTVVLANATGGAVDLDEGTLKVVVIRGETG